jgi:hypothetical protein
VGNGGNITPGRSQDARGARWLEEADDFDLMLMAESNCYSQQRVVSRLLDLQTYGEDRSSHSHKQVVVRPTSALLEDSWPLVNVRQAVTSRQLEF